MSSLFCFMDFMWRYHGSKGVPERLVEDGVLGNLAPPGDLEESASHHDQVPVTGLSLIFIGFPFYS